MTFLEELSATAMSISSHGSNSQLLSQQRTPTPFPPPRCCHSVARDEWQTIKDDILADEEDRLGCSGRNSNPWIWITVISSDRRIP